jgi:hypothetical protein
MFMTASIDNTFVKTRDRSQGFLQVFCRNDAGRVNSALVRRAKRKSGITSDSALIEAGLLKLAAEVDFGRWLAAQAGRQEKDFDIGL